MTTADVEFPRVDALLHEVEDQASLAPPAPTWSYGAGKATILFIVYVMLQGFGGAIVGFVGGLSLAANGMLEQAELLYQFVIPLATLVGMITGSVICVELYGRWTGGPVRHLRSITARFRCDDRDDMLRGVGLGLVISGLYIASSVFFVDASTEVEGGSLTKMAAGGGLGFVVWVVLALLLAPVLEELVFRDVLFVGYARTYGTTASMVITTLIFAALHLPETIYFPPAILATTSIGAALVWLRVRSGSLGASWACHFSYNGIVVAAAVLGA